MKPPFSLRSTPSRLWLRLSRLLPTTQSFEPMHRSALDLSKQLLKAFDSRKEMVDAGPTGLPGFAVFGPTDEKTGERGAQLFALELDVDNDRI